MSIFMHHTYIYRSVATVAAEVCRDSSPYSVSQPIYLREDLSVIVSWYAWDNVGFREFYVGIIAGENYTGISSPIEYSATGGQTHFSIYDPELISGGSRFYISVIISDVALHEVRQDI